MRSNTILLGMAESTVAHPLFLCLLFLLPFRALASVIKEAQALGGSVSEISLSGSSLSGTLDALDFTSLPNLAHFDASNNNLRGSIPSPIGNLSKLTFLDLGFNLFGGGMPPEMGRLQEIQYLSLLKNNLEGTVPYHISNLRNVWHLDLQSNYLKSSDWSKFSVMPSVTYLSLSENELHGKFPGLVANCQNLTYLDLSLNRLTGEIPEAVYTNLQFALWPDPVGIGSLENLVELDLSTNSLSSQIPSTLGNLRNLQSLQFFFNKLTGTIPPEVRNLMLLTILNLNPNQLHGEFIETISHLANLESISLFTNNFSGTLPGDFVKYSPSLHHVRFSNNSFTGELPPELCSGFALQELVVNENKFTGLLPDCLRDCLGITTVLLEGNHFTADITRRIPDEMGNLGKLLKLNLSKNHLARDIPTSLGNLSKLDHLDLSENALIEFGLVSKHDGIITLGMSCKSSHHRKKVRVGVSVGVCCLLFLAIQIAVIPALRRQRNKLLDEEIKSLKKKEKSKPIIWEREGKFTFKSGDVPEVNRQSFDDGIRVLTDIWHRNVIKLHGSCSKRGCIYLVYEFVERGSLAKVLYGGTGAIEMDWGTRVNIIHGVAHAIAYLHHDCSQPIVHRDITLNNILLEPDLSPGSWISGRRDS
ncbi:hypothetical protein NL676_018987 [Syzygium grande]|nr:hypothetical protein NL676_018987 [Syzygium grande]